jgi:heat shock protein HtpX
LFQAYGLRTHIWNNRLKSLLLLAGFPFLLLLICFAFALIISALENPDVGQGIANALALTPALIPIALGASALWFVIAWFANQAIVDSLTGARDMDRRIEPRVYNLLENLCISRGITMPRLHIIDSPVLNAYASGVRQSQYTITVTRGLIDALDDAELEAVLGHELTHIRNRDVQLLVIAAVFVGIISLVGDMLVRAPRIFMSGGRGGGSSGGSSSSSSRGSGKGGGGAAILILIAVGIFILARVLAIALRMAMSRKREYMADAGSVELTKNADAMIRALEKIAGNSALEAPVQIRAMFIDYPSRAGFLGLFATHPPIEKRIDALVRFGGGRRQIAADEPERQAIEDAAPETADRPEFGKRTVPPGSPAEPVIRPWGDTS